MLGVTSIEHLSGVPESSDDSVALQAEHRRGFFEGWTAFSGGVSPGETVVLVGHFRLVPGAKVSISEAASGKAGAKEAAK